MNKLLAGPQESFTVDTDTNAATSAALAAPGAGFRWIVQAISVSADRAPTSPIIVQVLNNATVIKQYEISANAFSPMEINFANGLMCSTNVAATVTCTAGGASVKVTIAIAGKKVGAS